MSGNITCRLAWRVSQAFREDIVGIMAAAVQPMTEYSAMFTPFLQVMQSEVSAVMQQFEAPGKALEEQVAEIKYVPALFRPIRLHQGAIFSILIVMPF